MTLKYGLNSSFHHWISGSLDFGSFAIALQDISADNHTTFFSTLKTSSIRFSQTPLKASHASLLAQKEIRRQTKALSSSCRLRASLSPATWNECIVLIRLRSFRHSCLWWMQELKLVIQLMFCYNYHVALWSFIYLIVRYRLGKTNYYAIGRIMKG